MHWTYRLLSWGVLWASLGTAWANPRLASDLNLYRRLIEQVHPQPFASQDQSAFMQRLKQLQSHLATSTTPVKTLDFLRELARLNASLKCGHTQVMPPAALMKELMSAPSVFPVPVRISSSRLMIDSRRLEEIPFGSEVVAINGLAAEAVLRQLRPVIATDVDRIAAIDQRLEQGFSLYHAVRFQPQVSYHLVYRTVAGDKHEMTVPAVPLPSQGHWQDQRVSHKAFRYFNSPLHLSLLGSKQMGFLRLGHFLASPEEFRQKLTDIFQRLANKQIKYLIVDVRDNDGGALENAMSLLAFLIRKPLDLRLQAWTRLARIPYVDHLAGVNGIPVTAEAQGLKQVQRRLIEEFRHSVDAKGRRLGTESFDLNRVIEPAAAAFHGPIAVLQNAGTRSAASFFSYWIQQLQRGQLVGEATGGSGAQVNGNLLLHYRLPESGISVQIPAITVAAPEAASAQLPVQPDIGSRRTLKAWRRFSDPVFTRARQFLQVGSESSSLGQ
jgi:hypothetical protein